MDDSLLNRAFEVKEIPKNFDPSVPPSTGDEYLQHVMYEASRCARVVVADIDQSKIKNHVNLNLEIGEQIKTKALAPSAEWQHAQVTMFSDLRKRVELARKSGKFKQLSLPRLSDEKEWFQICFGEEDNKLEPSLTVLLSMSEPVLGRVLEYQLEWLQKGLRPNQGKWIYALLACLSLPLTPVTCSVLRDLVRQCAKMRCSEGSLQESDIIDLNLIICLVGKYFGQLDLAD